MSEHWAINEEQMTSPHSRATPSDPAPALTKGGRMLVGETLIHEDIPQGQRIYSDRAPALGASPGSLGWISSMAGSHVKTYPSPEDGPDSLATKAVSGLSSLESLANYGQDGAASRMFRGFAAQTADVISPASSPTWMNSGSMRRGQLWTLNTSESRNVAPACSLSEVLEELDPENPAQRRYWLSPRAARGILRRALRRGRPLPERLVRRLVEIGGTVEISTAAEPTSMETASESPQLSLDL